MASITHVAGYILQRCGDMTTMKMQKLAFYSQAHCLATRGYPLFPEDFQAWRGGPVSPALFNQHRGKFIIRKGELDSTITADEAQIVNEVVDRLAQLSGNQLSARTHSEDPWKNMREGLSPIEVGDGLISKESLQSYYSQHPVLG
ncbi:Panacea domain-containing protein [Actinotignum schaalii]|uniref:Panacea domain-containing protein n=1 Tax=Actinotignum schaalii TaxID=59505 RepID=UPI00373F73C1